MSNTADSMSATAVQQLITFMTTVGTLKDTPRTGWVENGIGSPESVSDHMYRVALLCLMCPDATLDRNKLARMALYHDVGESLIGDISPAMRVPKAEKHARETAAIAQLAGLLHALPITTTTATNTSSNTPSAPRTVAEELQQFFDEYEAQITPESRFVRDMDLLEMILQAYQYEKTYPNKDLGSFFRSGTKIEHPWARAIYDALCRTRAPHKADL